jgi:hypothetical protein
MRMSQKERINVLHLNAGQRFRVAAGGYTVSLIFGLAFFAFRYLAPALSSMEDLFLAIASALPLVLALLWERLSKVKLGEVEISLVEVTPKIDFELANAIQDSRGSGTPQLIQLIKTAIQKDDLELVEVNLRSSPYWWSTRLYLLAALADEYTGVERLIFVGQQAARVYLGMASPRAVRVALAGQFPSLETVFRTIFSAAGQGSTDSVIQVESIGYQWEGAQFRTSGPEPSKLVQEAEFRELVSPANLFEWLAGSLETESREWDGSPSNESLYGRILSCRGSFVPLVHNGHLEKVVNRHSLSQKIALSVVAD